MLQRKLDWNTPIHELSQTYVPLKRVNVEVTVRSFAANVTITQIFRNDETVPIEGVYCFPIEEHAAIYQFLARIGDREIVAQLKEKEQAQREYNDALRNNHGAYMLEQDEQSQDNFIINVGALLPDQECQIMISYVTELDLVENGTKIRLVIPTTIAPRYNPNIGGVGSPTGTTTKYVETAPYTIEFHCNIEKIGITRVSSVSHPIQIDLDRDDIYRVEFAQENTRLDRDIIVDIELDKKQSSTIVAVESGAIMASFVPTKNDCQLILNSGQILNEFIFVIDCSGSMDEHNKIGLARQAMLLFLKSLPVNCHFNIIRFGSEYHSLFKDVTAIYNNENSRQAEKLINNMKADLGGTELLRPVQWLKKHPPTEGYARQLFLLSDGEISNVDEVLDICRSMATTTRIFSFGLGSAPSRALIKGLARTTNGRFVFIPPSTSVDIYVGEQMQKALQPCFNNVKIKLNPDYESVHVIPTNSPPVFVNDRLIFYMILDNDKSTTFDHNTTVELYSGIQRLAETKLTQIPSVSNDSKIARLAAKALISELQHLKLPSSNNEIKHTKETIKKRILEISLKHNILSPYTAFLGIEKRTSTSNADMDLREVPIQISAHNQYSKYLEQVTAQIHRDQMRNRAKTQKKQAEMPRMHELTMHEMQHFQREYHDAQNYLCRIHDDYAHRQNRLQQAQIKYEEARKRLEECKQIGKELLEETRLLQEMNAPVEIQRKEHIRVEIEQSLREKQDAIMRFEKASEELKNFKYEMHHVEMEVKRAEERCFDLNSKMALQELDLQMGPMSFHDYDDNDDRLSSEMNYVEILKRCENEKQSSRQLPTLARTDNTAELDIIRDLINKQRFDGLWDVDTGIVERLTGKPLSTFQQIDNMEVLISAIIVLVLETRFASLSSMWYGIVKKARKCLVDMYINNPHDLDILLEDIQKQL